MIFNSRVPRIQSTHPRPQSGKRNSEQTQRKTNTHPFFTLKKVGLTWSTVYPFLSSRVEYIITHVLNLITHPLVKDGRKGVSRGMNCLLITYKYYTDWRRPVAPISLFVLSTPRTRVLKTILKLMVIILFTSSDFKVLRLSTSIRRYNYFPEFISPQNSEVRVRMRRWGVVVLQHEMK